MGLFKDLIQQYQLNQNQPQMSDDELTLEDAVVELQDRVRTLEAIVSDLLRELDAEEASMQSPGQGQYPQQ
jgi:predicted  nucleic acid-binding Zn-ribbon protein